MGKLTKAEEWSKKFTEGACPHGTGLPRHKCVSCYCEIIKSIQVESMQAVVALLPREMWNGPIGAQIKMLSLEIIQR